MRTLPPLDLHAHIDTGIEATELTALRAVVFAVTRSLDEAEQALKRSDNSTIWGVGCHPGLIQAQKAFNPERFQALAATTPYVGELGLDGTSRVPMDMQQRTLRTALQTLQNNPRITSLHSYRATSKILSLLDELPQPGLILHWWLGNASETRRAVEIGCYFSVNRSSIRRTALLSQIPLDRVLPETDHPFGDKGRGPRRPGEVGPVEMALAEVHGLRTEEIRTQTWQTLASIVRETRTGRLLPGQIRRQLATV
ncbi:MAG: TatD family hydrolase [Acidimicrobiaceae bacterium]|nr:TatD family hydrolase [Acidimicrobiaceae bacterium]